MRFHDLRHTSGTLLSEAGVEIEAISERLGQSTTSTTQNLYGHITPRMRRGAAATIGRILDGVAEDGPASHR